MATGKRAKITISSSTNMSKEEVEKAVQDAEKYAAEDKKKREEVDAKMKLKTYVSLQKK